MGQTKDHNIGMCCFSTKYAACKGERTNTDWLGIMIMCPSGATCLTADWCFSELGYGNPTKRVGIVQSEHLYHLIKSNLFSSWYTW
jgi:hypothetical protein